MPAAPGYSPMAAGGHAQDQAAFPQQGPSSAHEPGSASGADNHQHLLSLVQQPQQQQQQQAAPAAQQQPEWLTPTSSHLQGQQQQPQGQQQQPQPQQQQQAPAQRTKQQRQLLVSLWPK